MNTFVQLMTLGSGAVALAALVWALVKTDQLGKTRTRLADVSAQLAGTRDELAMARVELATQDKRARAVRAALEAEIDRLEETLAAHPEIGADDLRTLGKRSVRP